MRIAYITAHAPFGRGETFVVEEMIAVNEQGVELLIVPRNPPKEVFHGRAKRLLGQTIRMPLFNKQIVFAFLKSLVSNPKIWRVFWLIFRHSRTLKILIKNLVVTPKGVFIADLFRKAQIAHIHAHWGSTTSTMGLIASELTGIPWSFTLHRWDIAENNLLEFKVKHAAFVRCISEDGRRELLSIIGNTYQDKVEVVYMGVRIPPKQRLANHSRDAEFVIACPGNLLPKKGHSFLIEACGILVKKGLEGFRCLIIGDGPLEQELRRQVASLGLEKVIEFLGRLAHERLLEMYEKDEVDVVVLPSVVTDEGEKEGIPVALMEAMAYGLPVISTDTGGIPELLSNGAGIIVRERNADQLADAIQKLWREKAFAIEVGQRGRRRVEDAFNIQKNVERLIMLMRCQNPKEETKR